MASINDLATAATIASSAVALQTEETTATHPPAQQTSTPPPRDRDMSPDAIAALIAASAPDKSKPTTSETGVAANASGDGSVVDGDSITVATGAPPVLAAPHISSPPPQDPSPAQPLVQAQAQAQIPGSPSPAPTPASASAAAAAARTSLPTSRPGSLNVGNGDLGRQKPVRGAFVVFEGMDRAGKTTQAKLLQQRCVESGREARFMRFPDRTTLIGRMIDSYLKGEREVEDHVIHLLFSANRWESAKKIKAELEAGHTIICDRFYHSGIVYSAAKEIKDLSLSWAKAPEVGLPRPDIVLFLDLEEEVARKRGGWGGEVYEKGEMQRRVRDLFWGLSMGDLGNAGGNNSAKTPRKGADGEKPGNGSSSTNEEGEFRQEEEDIQIVDADVDVESLSERVWEHALPRLQAVERGEVGKTVRVVR